MVYAKPISRGGAGPLTARTAVSESASPELDLRCQAVLASQNALILEVEEGKEHSGLRALQQKNRNLARSLGFLPELGWREERQLLLTHLKMVREILRESGADRLCPEAWQAEEKVINELEKILNQYTRSKTGLLG